MLVLGLQGSPRKKGNTRFLLSTLLEEAERLGARTRTIEIASRNILPCKELVVCEKKGFCPIDDDMKSDIYACLREADVILLASPVFFYNVTAQLKALIDRCQMFWARKYRLKLSDPARKYRRGFLLAAGATRGRNLFEGMKLTAQYFFDAVGAEFAGSLTYHGIEGPQDMQNHATVREDIKKAARDLLEPLSARQKVLFACRENACRSQMAGAFAQALAGDRLDVATGGSRPAASVDPTMVAVMQEKQIDMAYRRPQSIDAALENGPPRTIVTMGCAETCPQVPGARILEWDLPDPSGQDLDGMRAVRDRIEENVKKFVQELSIQTS
ncbi:MAG: NAD(P)H-dependent oxidoreductase [Desulfobacterales bacterium]